MAYQGQAPWPLLVGETGGVAWSQAKRSTFLRDRRRDQPGEMVTITLPFL